MALLCVDDNMKLTPARFQIVFTYKCNLACKWCDRFLDVIPWNDTDMFLDDLVKGSKRVKQSGVRVSMSRIGGGEPTMHPQFEVMASLVRERWSNQGEVKTTVATNGVAKRPKGLGVHYRISPPDTKDHFPVMISPADLGFESTGGYITPCRVSKVCGRLFDCHGFAPCPYAGTIGRLLQIDPYHSHPVLLGTPEICRHCIHSLGKGLREKLWGDAKKGRIEYPTKRFTEALLYRPLDFKRFQER